MATNTPFEQWHRRLTKSVTAIGDVAKEMRAFLVYNEKRQDWNFTAWACLGTLWMAMSKEHSENLPEMACQRSGRCCTKQVPRVSVFELEWMARAMQVMPSDRREAALQRCRDSVTATYKNSILGEGVPCPMLSRDADGKHMCDVHNQRPYTCRLSAVTTPTSWDCPLWEIYADHFPMLPADIVRPFLTLFAYCRNTYARDYLGVDRKQMMLVGTGILALFGEHPPDNDDPFVNAALRHTPECSDDLYMRDMGAPPPTGII